MGRAFSPLDEELALLPGAFAPSLVADAVRLGTWVPFGRIPALLHGFVRTWLSEPTVRRVTEAAGAAYVTLQTAEVERLERTGKAPPAGPTVLQASVDGAMVPLRGKAEWTEVKTLAVGAVDTTAGEATAVELSYFSRRADHETFTRLASVETHRRGLETAGTVCGVADGADWCQQFFDTQRPDAVRILDFSHAASYLAQIAQVAFGPGTVAAATWLETQRHTLKHETPEPVLATIRSLQVSVAARPDGAAPAEVIGKALAYLEKRVDQLRYATFQQHGYPIGSGIVESANKLVVEARLKGAGMHWAPEHVDPMVALRTVVCADRWDDAWPQICGQLRHDHCARARARHTQRVARAGALRPSPRGDPPMPPPLPPDLPAPAAAAAAAAAREPLSYGPGRPAPNHPWKRRFILPSRSLSADAKL